MFTALWLFSLGLAAEQQKKQHANGMNYLLYSPETYKANAGKQQKFPLLIFLHGGGEGKTLKSVAKHGPPMLVRRGREFPFFIVSPQCKEQGWYIDEKLIMANAVIDEVIKNYPIDKSRVYLTGLSNGGCGTFNLAMMFPEKFAALAPICGYYSCTPDKLAAKLKNIPIWIFHGKIDEVIPCSYSGNAAAALKKTRRQSQIHALSENPPQQLGQGIPR